MAASPAAPVRKSVSAAPLVVGERVTVGSMQIKGVLKFAGETQFSEGEWMGIELDTPSGKNDGTVKGVSYFTCKPNHGLFVRRSAITREEAPKAKPPSASLKKSGTTKLKDTATPPASPAPSPALGAVADAKAGGKAAAASPTLAVSEGFREALRPSRGPEAAPSSPQPTPSPGRPETGTLQKQPTKTLKSAKSFQKEAQTKRPPESPPPPSTGEAESEDEERAPPGTPQRADDQNGSAVAGTGASGKVNGAGAGAAAAPQPPGGRLAHLEDPVEVERHAAQQALASAAEEHDPTGIRKALPRARTAGVDEAEIACAQRVLSYEMQSWLTQEVEGICSTMKRLKQTVDDVEARVGALDTRLAASPAGGGRCAALARPLAGESPEGEDAWLSSLGQQLERRVWEGLESQVEAAIQGAVARATRELLAAAAEVGQLRGQAGVAPAPARPQVPRAVPGQYGSYSERWRRAARRIMRLRFTASALSTGDVRSFTAASAVGALEASLAEDEEFDRIMAQWGQKGSRQSVVTRDLQPPRAAPSTAERDAPPPCAPPAGPGDAPSRELVRATISLALQGSVARIQMQDGSTRKSASSKARSSLRQAYMSSSKRKTVTFPDDIALATSPEEPTPAAGETEAATRIQATFRGHRDREETARRQAEVEARRESEAATAIQARYRGHRGRESVLRQDAPEDYSATATGVPMDETEAATKIQARYRGHRDRDVVAHSAHEDLDVGVEACQKALFGLLLAEPGGLPARSVLVSDGAAAAATPKAQDSATALDDAKAAVDDIEACGRRMEAARAALQQKVDDAASLVQARYRGQQARREATQRAEGVQKLQQAFRRMQVNRKAGQSADFYRVALLMRKRNQAFVDGFLEVARRGGGDVEQGLGRDGFLAAITDVHAAALCEAQAQALWRGFEDGTGASSMGLRVFCNICEAVAGGDSEAAEYADMDLEQWVSLRDTTCEEQAGAEESAEAADCETDGEDFPTGSRSAASGLGDKWANHFRQGMNLDGFVAIMRGVRPTPSKAQLKAIWDARASRSGATNASPDFVDFSLIAEAVVTDAHAAAEFADLPVEHYLMLGANGAETAASEIQAVFRGKAARKEIREQQAAAAGIQAVFRGNAARKEIREQQDAALKIQSTYRGRMTRTQTFGDDELQF